MSKFKLTLIENWTKFYRMYTFWGLALIGALPDLYDMAVESNLFVGDDVPPMLSYAIKVIAFLTFAMRLVKQQALNNAVDGNKNP